MDILVVSQVFLSQIVLFELEYGNEKSMYPERGRRRLQIFLGEGIEALNFEAKDARVAAQIRTQLEARKLPIGPYDTLIAGQALARGYTLVTSNQREFARVDGLLWEDWSQAES
jgi:tRNA(fMet)-specific endonuclease VapC